MSDAKLIWDVAGKYGKCSVDPDHGIYDERYFKKYTEWGEHPVGKLLNRARIDLVNRHVGENELVLDIGCGACTFVKERGTRTTRGFDVMPHAIARLESMGALLRGDDDVNVLTFWDSFEHIKDPRDELFSKPQFVFMSIPVFSGPSAVIRSKHWKPGEHFWYFTEHGLVMFMGDIGYDLIERSRMEEAFTRDGIGTFVFHKR